MLSSTNGISNQSSGTLASQGSSATDNRSTRSYAQALTGRVGQEALTGTQHVESTTRSISQSRSVTTSTARSGMQSPELFQTGRGQESSSPYQGSRCSSSESPSRSYANVLSDNKYVASNFINFLTPPNDDQETNPLVISYNTQINHEIKNNKVDVAWQLIEKMKEAGLKPNSHSFNPFLNFYVKKGNEIEIENVLKRMSNEKISSNSVTYRLLIDFYVNTDRFEKANFLFNKVKPTLDFGQIDLHGLSHGLAYMVVRNCLNSNQFDILTVITGRGSHSTHDLVKMKEFIKKQIGDHHKDYKCQDVENPGVLKIIKKTKRVD